MSTNNMNTPVTMNGATVLARAMGTIFIRIPRELQQPINGGCGCDYCKAHPTLTPMWDTLCVATKAPKNTNDFSWTTHAPEPKHLWDAERQERDAKRKAITKAQGGAQ